MNKTLPGSKPSHEVPIALGTKVVWGKCPLTGVDRMVIVPADYIQGPIGTWRAP